MRRRNWDEEKQATMLDALIARLNRCRPGATYNLDPVEREVILIALDNQQQTQKTPPLAGGEA